MPNSLEIAETVRAACLRAALDAYEDAGMRGLCGEGRWELAVQAIRRLDLQSLVAKSRKGMDPPPGQRPQ
jgi:hypothetical protein